MRLLYNVELGLCSQLFLLVLSVCKLYMFACLSAELPYLNRLPMRLLYNLELGFYISSIFMIQVWEVRRKDHWPMFSHHIATATLIATSMHFR
jgi:hypothetical protein